MSEKTTDNTAVDKVPSARPKKLLAINSSICLALICLIALAVHTANYWEKVDVPEQQETFREETRKTGYWIVHDDGIDPCYIGQSWYECINLKINQYNSACANRALEGESGAINTNKIPGAIANQYMQDINAYGKYLGSGSERVCNMYKEQIDQMQAWAAEQGNAPGLYVAQNSSGVGGHLTATEETETAKVSNNDYVPAQTHTAICVFGIFGECNHDDEDPQPDTKEG